MFIPDDEKEGRKEALQKLMDMMSSETSKKLGGLKPVGASMTLEKEVPAEGEEENEMEALKGNDMEEGDEGEEEDDDDEYPSDEEKMKISELYHKYCYGGKV